MSESLDLPVGVKSHVTSNGNGMEKVEDLMVKPFAKYPKTEMKQDAHLQLSGSSTKAKMELTGAGDTGDQDPTKPTKIKSGLVSEILTQYLKEFGPIPEDDLKMLRQITKDCYQALNSRFWDALGSCIKITATSPSGGTYDDSKIIKITILDSNLKEVKNFEDITSEVWETEIKPQFHTFRTLLFEDYGVSIVPNTDLKWNDVVTVISPYITKLQLDIVEFGSRSHPTLTGEQIGEFIQRFENMKKLKISFYYTIDTDGDDDNTDVGELDTLLRGLKPSIPVEVKLEEMGNQEPVFNRCGDIPNISWNVSIGEFDGIVEVWAILDQQPNLNVTLKIDWLFVEDLDELRQITEFSQKFQDKIIKHNLNIVLSDKDEDFEDQDESAVINYLRVLSSFVTELNLMCARNWNIIESDGEAPCLWPKLKYLGLDATGPIGGNIPLAIKNGAPNLEKLVLEGDQDNWIFRDPGQPDITSIQNFFSPLSQLESLYICDVNGKIQEGNELDGVVKSMLPKLKELVYEL